MSTHDYFDVDDSVLRVDVAIDVAGSKLFEHFCEPLPAWVGILRDKHVESKEE